MGRKHNATKSGKGALNAFQVRHAKFSAEGLPNFCLLKYYAATSNMYSVPLWDLPEASRWMPKELACDHCSCEAVEHIAEGPRTTGSTIDIIDSRNDEYPGPGELDSEHEEAEGSNEVQTADGDMFYDNQGTWSRAMVNHSPVIFRRVHVSDAIDNDCYFVGLSTSLFPQRVLLSEVDIALDRYLIRTLNSSMPRWAVLALSSCGHFAGAIFDGPTAIAHKTLHRYTSRAKQGGSQAAFDAMGKKPKSAGSNLRRYCQQRLGEDINELLTKTWASDITSCERIFISVSPKMRSVLTGSTTNPHFPLERTCRLPFAIPRPTFEAIRDAYTRVSQVLFLNQNVMNQLIAQTSKRTKAAEKFAKHEPEDALYTPLHGAAAYGDEDLVLQLLESGADPTAQDSKGRVPYDLCLSRGARRAFCVFRDQHQATWDWSRAGIPIHPKASDVQCERKTAKTKKGRHVDRPNSATRKATVKVGLENESGQSTDGKRAGKNFHKGRTFTSNTFKPSCCHKQSRVSQTAVRNAWDAPPVRQRLVQFAPALCRLTR